MSHEARLARLGLTLPVAPAPIAKFAPAITHGDLVYTSGHGPVNADGSFVVGKLGSTFDVEQGRAAARLTGLGLLATLRAHLGSLDRITRIVKVLGMVNATPDFSEHPKVIDGFTALMLDVFGDAGLSARSAVGMISLPAGIAVEIELIASISGPVS
ncbi:MAG: RidA family protein [Deltaproteobacteria bacterium]